MKAPLLIFVAILLSVSTRSLSYNEDEGLSKSRDFTYLDYVKAREEEYEYAMHLRDAMRREEDRFPGHDEDSFDEEGDENVDEQENYDDEDDNEERYDKIKRGLRRKERLKEEVNDKKDAKSIVHHKDGKFKDIKNSKYMKNKQNIYNVKSSKDAKNFEKDKSEPKSSRISKVKKAPGNDRLLKKTEGKVIEAREHNDVLYADAMPFGISKEENEREFEKKNDPTVVKTTQTTKITSKVASSAAKPIVGKKNEKKKLEKALFIVVVAACSVAGVAGLILASYCWYRLRAEQDSTPDEDTKKYVKKKKKLKKIELTNDEKLAKSAEVYHYMHTKKQLASIEKNGSERKTSNVESETSDEESDNTVYECPGLAPPGDMKVVNPLFSDAEKEHSDARSDGSHVSSPTVDKSAPKDEVEKEDDNK